MDDYDVDILVGSIGSLYTRHRLSPPSQLREAAKRWLGLSFTDILDTIEKHLEDEGTGIIADLETGISRWWRRQLGSFGETNTASRTSRCSLARNAGVASARSTVAPAVCPT